LKRHGGVRLAAGAAWMLLLAACAGQMPQRFSAADQIDIDRIGAYLNGLPRFEAHFVQSGSYGPGAGLVWLDRPGHLRIDYAGAGSRLMVISGGHVQILDRGNGAVTTMALSRTPLGLLLTPSITLSGPVTVTALRHEPGSVSISLIRTGQPGQGSLTLTLADPTLRLQAVTVTDPYARTLTMTLADIDTTPRLTPGLFDPPAGS
jgi:outer membrane lipoprotein-sorting protein